MLDDEIQKILIIITLTFYLSKYAINQIIFIIKIFKIENDIIIFSINKNMFILILLWMFSGQFLKEVFFICIVSFIYASTQFLHFQMDKILSMIYSFFFFIIVRMENILKCSLEIFILERKNDATFELYR